MQIRNRNHPLPGQNTFYLLHNKKSLDFKEGYSVGELQVQKSDESSGTYIRFLPDPKVFGESIAPDYNAIAQALKELMHTYPDFRCTLTDERTDSQYVI